MNKNVMNILIANALGDEQYEAFSCLPNSEYIGVLKVPFTHLQLLEIETKISSKSFMKGKYVYLVEDEENECDMDNWDNNIFCNRYKQITGRNVRCKPEYSECHQVLEYLHYDISAFTIADG